MGEGPPKNSRMVKLVLIAAAVGVTSVLVVLGAVMQGRHNSRSAAADKSGELAVPRENHGRAPAAITFAGVAWDQPAAEKTDLPDTIAFAYRNPKLKHRVLACFSTSKKIPGIQVFSMQAQGPDGKWVDDGLSEWRNWNHLISTEIIRLGERDGPCVFYHPNGRLAIISHYWKGKRVSEEGFNEFGFPIETDDGGDSLPSN